MMVVVLRGVMMVVVTVSDGMVITKIVVVEDVVEKVTCGSDGSDWWSLW